MLTTEQFDIQMTTVNDHNTNRAEEETRRKAEKSNEIKKINTQMMILRSEIAKMDDTLKEYQLYKNFLDKVTPQVSHHSRFILAKKNVRSTKTGKNYNYVRFTSSLLLMPKSTNTAF